MKLQNREMHALKLSKVLFELASCDECGFLCLVPKQAGLILHDFLLCDIALMFRVCSGAVD